MKKLFKWILGLLTGLVGILFMILGSSKKNKKIKEIKKDIKKVNKNIKSKKQESKRIKKSISSKKAELSKLKKGKKNYKPKDVNAKEAADFLKKYSKKKK
mgnify:FL=1|tara:strand:+ start:1698 stop:1997 length:300 start_codon:yes stop_codon:yes gene_type:complete